MAGPVSAYLLDTNVILRLYHPHSPEFPFIRKAITSLHRTNVGLYYFSQNLIEFWSVSTRPISQNGYGLSPAETDQNAKQIEKAFILLPEVKTIHNEWRRLVVDYGVSGAKVHDARLVAGMIAHGIRHILTLDESDFARYTEVIAVSPKNIS
ncbi:MAG TPA: PIN domain-containing protein [Candidatus Angelobacter sp.]|nr:PIN domain-containing protein [Candidatus Angelobacter sp.]